MNNETTTTKDQAELLETWALNNGVINRVAAAPQPNSGTTITLPTAAISPPLVPLKLSIRRPDELLKMKFDDNDILLGDRMLAKGQFLVIAGPAGIGKSRFVLQLATSLILKKQFLTLDVKNESGPCLVLQTENSNRRLMQDIGKLKAAHTAEEWNKINDNLILHTLEKNQDYLLGLGDPVNMERLRELINDVQPGVIVFDPLYTFGVGDLNTDADMTETCRKLQSLGLENNIQRALIVLHHALTGKAGAMKAMGYDRSSFGRNSKSLIGWTRGQINLAPGSPDDNDTVVVSCAKNSNGKPFKPFAVKLNNKTMLYEVDHMFDFQRWDDEIRGRGKRPRKVTETDVAELLGEKALTHAELVKLIMEQKEVGKTTANDIIKEATDKTIHLNPEDKRYHSL